MNCVESYFVFRESNRVVHVAEGNEALPSHVTPRVIVDSASTQPYPQGCWPLCFRSSTFSACRLLHSFHRASSIANQMTSMSCRFVQLLTVYIRVDVAIEQA
jgi:hypothetical protein